MIKSFYSDFVMRLLLLCLISSPILSSGASSGPSSGAEGAVDSCSGFPFSHENKDILPYSTLDSLIQHLAERHAANTPDTTSNA